MKSSLSIFDAPLALLPSAAAAMLEEVRTRMLRGSTAPDALLAPAAPASEWKPYDLVAGVAIIPISGVLVHEDPYYWSDETQYARIAGQFVAAIQDEDVRGILMHVNSPGGVVSGCFDLSDAIFGLRGSKPIWSIVDESCYSAAYALASASDRILMPRTAGIGSIGVITMHVDVTKMLENFGVKVTMIQYGARKADSYPTVVLSDEARERMQADVDTLGEMFVDLVARNRGIEASTVRETEAACFLGEDGIKAGLADAAMPVDQALLEFIEHVNT
ncbi:S49 family peptidase [Bradyrhizobium japonicum]|uniref:S49 family peptidase n=1 Tax=Bradyrhizobium japonicum TaxID=375 RepID=UPI00040C962C|nr:S49 family peptidase [Bradyrhizobium japonicum]